MYFVFEELPSIITQATQSQIQEWKNNSVVKRCYSNLFKKIKQDQSTTYMSKILEKLRKENRSPSKIQIAYTISVCETYLYPYNPIIQMNEGTVKPKITKNLVSFNFQFCINVKMLKLS